MSRESARRPDIDIVKELALNLLKRTSLDDLLWEIAGAIGRLPKFEDCVVYLVEGDELVQKAAFGLKQKGSRELFEPIVIPIGHGIVGAVAKTGIAENISDTSLDPRYIFDQFAGASELTVPVVYEGEVIAVIDTESEQRNAYNDADMEMLQTMANVSASRIASAINEREKERLSREYARLNRELESRVLQRTGQLEATNADLILQRDRLASILNSIQDGLICADHNFKVRLFSPSAADITGWAITEALGKSLGEVFRLKGVADSEELILKTSQDRRSRESILLTCGGEERDIRWGLGVSQDHDSNREYVVVFGDTTQANLVARQSEQIQRLESLGILAGGIAHDFNNNLTAIQSALTVVGMGDHEATKEAIEITGLACDSARSLAQQLMTFAKGGAPIKQTANLRELLFKASAVVLPGTNCKVVWELPAEDCFVFVDPGQIGQVFTNLFLNAAQAMDNSGQIRVRIETDTDDHLYCVIIEDEGPGIAEERLESIFEPYYSSKPAGSGLGLTISYFVMKRHGGSLALSNHPAGALAKVGVPRSEAVAQEDRTATQPASSEQRRILVMDDDQQVRKGVSLLVSSFGHSVIEAIHGDHAIDLLQFELSNAGRVDLAILDLRVHDGRGGAEVVKEMRQMQKDLVCVVSSGYSQDPVMSRYSDYGFQGVLPKPFSRSDVADLFAQLL